MAERTEFDYIVVGGGTAGAVVGARLAEDPGLSVCIVEGGPSVEGDELITDIRNWIKLPRSRYDYDYAIEPQPRGNGAIRIARGRMLGGCSSHNQTNAVEPPDSDLEDWERLGAAGWGPNGLSEARARVREKVNIEQPGHINPLVEDFLEAGQQAGLPLVDMARPPAEGIGIFYKSKKGYMRQSSAICYLDPIAALPGNLTIRFETWVSCLLIEGDRVAGVVTSAGELAAKREVIVCAGAIDSPRLLLLSGIGPADQLRALGIEPWADLPGVGENLMDHPDGFVLYEARSLDMYPEEDRDLSDAVFYAKSEPALAESDFRGSLGIYNFDFYPPIPGTPTAEAAVVIDATVRRPKSRGFVRLGSADPAAPPVIDFRYFQDEEGHDERVLVAGTKICRRIMEQPALARHLVRELFPGAHVTSDEAISEAVRAYAASLYHPAGTCKIGRADDAMAVVAPDLRVRGFRNLRVADASIFPTMVSVSPNITAMMIGEKCADLVRGG